MEYIDMLKEAKKSGFTNEQKMWDSIASISELLSVMKAEHPDDYWAFMRDQHCIMYGPHYDTLFADYDVARLEYSDKNGATHKGAHWTREQVDSATAAMHFPTGTTKCDVWVAANAMYADLNKHFDDAEILQAMFDFFFADEDWRGSGKVWEYMSLNS